MQSPSYKPKWFFFVLFAHVLLIIIWQPQYQCENDKSCHKSTKKLNGTKNMTVNWLCVNESFYFTSCTSLEKRLFLAKFNTVHLHLGLGPILIAHWIFVLLRSTWSPHNMMVVSNYCDYLCIYFQFSLCFYSSFPLSMSLSLYSVLFHQLSSRWKEEDETKNESRT